MHPPGYCNFCQELIHPWIGFWIRVMKLQWKERSLSVFSQKRGLFSRFVLLPFFFCKRALSHRTAIELLKSIGQMSPDRIFFFSSFNHKHIFLVKCIPEIGIVLQVKVKKKGEILLQNLIVLKITWKIWVIYLGLTMHL